MKISIKKCMLIALSLFLTIESGNGAQPRRLKPKLKRQQKAVTAIFKTDDQQKIAQEVATINTQAATAQGKRTTREVLQAEIAKETKEIKQELAKAQNEQPHYITYNEALDIIKSKKELSRLKSSSWTTSAIIKPFVQTYRLFLRVWNQKEYTALLEKERNALEHELNVQAHNNLMLLYVALDLEFKQAGLNTDHMFKKDNFYKITTHAFEGGALLAADIAISPELKGLFDKLGHLVRDLLLNNYTKNYSSFEVIQSMYSMAEVIEGAIALRINNKWRASIWNAPEQLEVLGHSYRLEIIGKVFDEDNFYSLILKEDCEKIAKSHHKTLQPNKKTYAQYAKDWISEPKNLAKAGLVLGAIGGLYVFGPAVPAWLKEYTNKSVTSLVESVKSGTTTMINSVKNLWNKIYGNNELPNSKELRVTLELENGAKITKNFNNTDDFSNYFSEELYQTEPENITKEYQQAGQALNDFDTENQLEAKARKQEQENAADFDKYHQEYQEKLDTNTFESQKSRDRTMRNEGKEYFYNQMPESDAETLRFADTHLDDMIIEGNPHNDAIRKQVYFELDKPYQDYYQRKHQAQNQEKQRMFDEEQAQLARERTTQETKKESATQPEVPEIDIEFERKVAAQERRGGISRNLTSGQIPELHTEAHKWETEFATQKKEPATTQLKNEINHKLDSTEAELANVNNQLKISEELQADTIVALMEAKQHVKDLDQDINQIDKELIDTPNSQDKKN